MDESVPREKALIAYDLTLDFLRFLENGQIDTLKERFGVSSSVLSEIEDALAGYSKGKLGWTLPPKELAFSGALRIFDVFPMHDPQTIGIESNLWLDGKEQEPVIHATIQFSDHEAIFQYRYIGS